jgi:hypothetical protein
MASLRGSSDQRPATFRVQSSGASIKDGEANLMYREEVLPKVLLDLAIRVETGAKEYGERLSTFNGRDALTDAYEEALDLAMYLKQAIIERDATGSQ